MLSVGYTCKSIKHELGRRIRRKTTMEKGCKLLVVIPIHNSLIQAKGYDYLHHSEAKSQQTIICMNSNQATKMSQYNKVMLNNE